MLRALGRASGLQAAALRAMLQQEAAIPSTLTLRRLYSADSTSSSSDAPSSSEPSSPRPSRLQTKEWRSWIDTKLDKAIDQQQGAAPAGAARPAAAAAAAAPAARPAPRPSPRAKGFELEQQIYSIVAPGSRAGDEEGTLPPGVTSYGQLAMASDAPRFLRAAANVADISPQRLHPTRLFFPQQTYAPKDLDPYKTSPSALGEALGAAAAPVPSPDDVTRYGDYKNAPLLAAFLSDAGKLPLRRDTHMRAKLHRHLSRQIKIARQLAILNPTKKWRPAGYQDQRAQRAERRQQRQEQQRARQQSAA